MTDHPAPPRIFFVTYKSAHNGRVARFAIKVPYGVYRDGLYALTEELTRLQLTGQITKYTIEVARPSTITPEVRNELTRWREAITRTTARTKVEWT